MLKMWIDYQCKLYIVMHYHSIVFEKNTYFDNGRVSVSV